MSAPSLGERLLIARIAARRSLAAAGSRIVTAPGLGWRLVKARADELRFIPSDLRPADPSLVDEIASGQMGLGGRVLDLGGSSPFAVAERDPAWGRELNGFAWLGSLRAAGSQPAVDVARRLVTDWCRRNRGRPGGRGVAAEPEVAARRVTSWVVGAGFLLEEAEPEFYRLFTRALGAELRALDAASRTAAPGYPALACRMAVALACLATEGHDQDLPSAEKQLLAELGWQILGDGGHVTRNPEVVVDILLDILPIRQCYAARGMPAPAVLVETIERMLMHLRAMAIGPAALARFNGVGSSRLESIATVLSVEVAPGVALTRAPGPSGYARLERNGTTVIVDCGRPPPLALSATAHAGALSFAMAHAGESLIVNGGTPAAGHRRAAADARATASHSTLTLDEQSSSRLVRSRRLERLIGGPALAGPDRVTASLLEVDGEVRLVAEHDGYLSRFGLIHERRLTLSRDGRSLTGTDLLRPPHGALRLARDVPLAVHFHMSIEATARTDQDGGGVVIEPESGPAWRLTARGGRLAIEAAVDFAQSQGPSPARQAVIRAATPGETTISWRLDQL